jgi:hypothetical protein
MFTRSANAVAAKRKACGRYPQIPAMPCANARRNLEKQFLCLIGWKRVQVFRVKAGQDEVKAGRNQQHATCRSNQWLHLRRIPGIVHEKQRPFSV